MMSLRRAGKGRGYTSCSVDRRLVNSPACGEMWYWVFLWCLFSSLFLHGAGGLLMLVMLQRHRWGRLITVVLVSVGFLASLSGAVITSAAVAGVYRVAGKGMAPLEALVFGAGQTSLSIIISFSRILATL
ncbi:transmembrane protein 170B isoform X2 [Poeciliopsis prolifica]|uniref:transmembrane protein 170B isoform X2 n=1 Tax=Poeciliopsis prolifica TaxID=188132 RepID=UPI0024130E03|nr:transmembrane protein 170B isoform X2 [Poeciliopsis prolifica]